VRSLWRCLYAVKTSRHNLRVYAVFDPITEQDDRQQSSTMTQNILPQLRIRTARLTDLAALEQQLDGSTGRTMTQELDDQTRGLHSLYIAYLDADQSSAAPNNPPRHIVGSGYIRWLGPRPPEAYQVYPDAPEIYRLGVTPSHQSRGIGTALIQAMHSAAEARGYLAVSLGVAMANPRARSLYQELGYQPSAIVEYEDRYLVETETGETKMIVDPCTYLIRNLRPTFSIRPAHHALPSDIGVLVERAQEEGHHHIQRLASEWLAGSNRFAAAGELFLYAVDQTGSTIGVVGLNRDPYQTGPADKHGRLRRMYVLPQWRRHGVARALLKRIELAAWGNFSQIQLNTSSTAAGQFYTAMGYQEQNAQNTNKGQNDQNKITHVKQF